MQIIENILSVYYSGNTFGEFQTYLCRTKGTEWVRRMGEARELAITFEGRLTPCPD